MYVFGYGSLIWDPGFEFEASELAEIKHYKRSFSMWSIHHRGTIDKPGLVLALEKSPNQNCKGIAFEVSSKHSLQVLSYLASLPQDHTPMIYFVLLIIVFVTYSPT